MHGGGVAGLLLAAIGGYWVLERAEGHKGSLRKVGRLLGGLIIIVSLVGMLCKIWCLAVCPMGKGGMMGKGGYCPFTIPKSSAPAP